jgi:putative copper export protein
MTTATFAFLHWLTLLALCALVGGLAFAPLAMRSPKAVVAREFAEIPQRKWLSFWLIANVLLVVPTAFMDAPPWVLLGRLVMLVLLAELLKRRRESSWPALLLGAALLLTQSLGSRSARLPDWVMPSIADWVHLTFAATWLGGVAMLLVVVHANTQPAQPADMQPSIISSLSFIVDRFSLAAMFCVVGLAITGIAQAGIFIKSFEDLWMTDYGRALSFKVILFVALIGFGAFHQQVVAPALRRAVMSEVYSSSRGLSEASPYSRNTPRKTLSRFRLSLAVEALVGAILLSVVGLLISFAASA